MPSRSDRDAGRRPGRARTAPPAPEPASPEAEPAHGAGPAALRLEAAKTWHVERPLPEFLELPVRYRWEFTRRHPHYLRFWRLARPDHVPQDQGEAAIAGLARAVILALGVTDVPPPPGTPFEDLLDGLAEAALAGRWESGAVAQPTLKGLVATLALLLPQDVLADVGRYLTEIGVHPDGSVDKRKELLRPLLEASVPALNLTPQLMLTVNPYAPQAAIESAVLAFVRRWKGELAAPETRPRPELLPETLRAWDLREGWAGDRYDVTTEKTLKEVARELRLPLATARNRYRAAFRWLIGHDYSPELWGRAFALDKLLPLVGDGGVPRLTLRRPDAAARDRGKAAAKRAVAPDRGRGRARAHAVRDRSPTELVDVQLDVLTLLRKGKTDAEILEELELSPAFGQLIEYQRARLADLGPGGAKK